MNHGTAASPLLRNTALYETQAGSAAMSVTSMQAVWSTYECWERKEPVRAKRVPLARSAPPTAPRWN
ncbi:hypothetical protein GCM10009861_23890 [Neomicrococcus aestuarii]